jgi:hypothetical protein
MKDQNQKEIIEICAWCKSPSISGLSIENLDPNSYILSHTICEKCEKEYFPKEEENE